MGPVLVRSSGRAPGGRDLHGRWAAVPGVNARAARRAAAESFASCSLPSAARAPSPRSPDVADQAALSL